MSRILCLIPLLAVLGGCAEQPTIAAGPQTPGWTGRTAVPGSSSSVVGDSQATDIQQKWGVGRQR